MNSASLVVAFDLDGTLFNSTPILGPAYQTAVAAANHDRRGVGLPTLSSPSTAEVLHFVGRPVKEIFAGLFPGESEPVRAALAQGVLDDLCSRIRRREAELYPGARELLVSLRRLGHPLVIVSNCRRAYLEAISAAFSLDELLEAARCNEDAPELGKPGLLKSLLAGRRGVMVGDRASDGEAARFAGVPWIGCDYGHAHDPAADELRGADLVVDSIAGIQDAVATLMAAS